MYIEFRLPSLDNRRALGYDGSVALTSIIQDIEAWASQHQITNYRTKRHKLTYRLVLANEQDYSYFALTWNPKFRASRHFELKQPK